jgi:hypothetical protein
MSQSKQTPAKPQPLKVWQVFQYVRPVVPVRPRFTT